MSDERRYPKIKKTLKMHCFKSGSQTKHIKNPYLNNDRQYLPHLWYKSSMGKKLVKYSFHGRAPT